MLYDIPTTIACVSSFTALAPGEVISTGSPGDAAASRRPPLWIRAGDQRGGRCWRRRCSDEARRGRIGSLDRAETAVS